MKEGILLSIPMLRKRQLNMHYVWMLVAVSLLTGCGGDVPWFSRTGDKANSSTSKPKSVAKAFANDPLLRLALEPWRGDLDGMIERGMLRIAVPFGSTTYYLERGTPQGITPMRAAEFEKFIKRKFGVDARKFTTVYIPAGRANLLQLVAQGRADIAGADITVTPERQKLVQFTIPFRSNVSEVLVVGPAAGGIKSADELLDTPIFVRNESSFAYHLEALNAERKATKKHAFQVEAIDPDLNSVDILELVNVGEIPATVADELIVDVLGRSLSSLRVLPDLKVAQESDIAWAVRKNCPLLKRALDAFVTTAREGTYLGNVIMHSYTKSPRRLSSAMAARKRAEFNEYIDLVKKYAAEYDFDWLLITSQAYQESRLDNSKRSQDGAVGIMQIKPSTAMDPIVGISDVSDPENNIHAGVKYLHFIRDRYFSAPEISDLDQTLMSFAAYNAGPAAIQRVRKEAEKLGLNGNIWLDNVEVAAQRGIGIEPVNYVRNIYKYYVAYRLTLFQLELRESSAKSENLSA